MKIRTRITEMLGIEFPLIQGGLWGMAFAELCGPVSEAGALGQITAGLHETPESLAREIEKVRQITRKPFGVNFPLKSGVLSEHLEVAIEKGCACVTLSAGDPTPLLKKVSGRVPTLVLVSTVRQAKRAEDGGASAVIVVGQEGGGLIGQGDTGTIVLTPLVVDAISIPVVASGGLVDGRGILAALALGAEGAEMGTRFIAVKENRAEEDYKQALVRAGDLGTKVVGIVPGLRGRCLAEDAEALMNEEPGDLASKLASTRERQLGQARGAGQSAGLIRDVPTVAELITRMRGEIEEAYVRMTSILGPQSWKLFDGSI